jgi:hypothetical protein
MITLGDSVLGLGRSGLGDDRAEQDRCHQPVAGPHLPAEGEEDAAEQEAVDQDEADGEGAEAVLERPAAVVPGRVEAPVQTSWPRMMWSVKWRVARTAVTAATPMSRRRSTSLEAWTPWLL